MLNFQKQNSFELSTRSAKVRTELFMKNREGVHQSNRTNRISICLSVVASWDGICATMSNFFGRIYGRKMIVGGQAFSSLISSLCTNNVHKRIGCPCPYFRKICSKMIISRKTFVAFSVLLIALRVTSAWAQDAAGKQQVAQTPPDVPKAAIGCDGSSKLTQEKFLDMLHAIVVHGDLTDVAFVEKTLETKLVVSPINGTSSDSDERSYGSETFFGQVDSVVMKIGFNSNEHSWNQEPLERKFAYMRLSIPKDGFHDCKPLTITQILTLLDAGFSGGEVHYNLDGSHALTVIGKDGVKVTITYTSTMPNAATLISISQRPRLSVPREIWSLSA